MKTLCQKWTTLPLSSSSGRLRCRMQGSTLACVNLKMGSSLTPRQFCMFTVSNKWSHSNLVPKYSDLMTCLLFFLAYKWLKLVQCIKSSVPALSFFIRRSVIWWHKHLPRVSGGHRRSGAMSSDRAASSGRSLAPRYAKHPVHW